MLKQTIICLSITCILAISGCILPGQQEPLNASKQQTLYNVKYGSYSRNVMDIALPKNRTTSTPVLVVIHGGGWVAGDKSVANNMLQSISAEGIACVAINYRYASDADNVHHPDLPNDVVTAMDYIASKSIEWQISPNRFGLVGQSAGAHLAMYVSYALNANGRIKACASWAGPSDFIDSTQLSIAGIKDLFKVYMGTGLNTASDTLLYKSASPYWIANNTVVPTLIIHGTNDEIVAYNTAAQLHNKLDSLGVINSFISLPGAGHGWGGTDITTAYNATLQWFLLYL